MIPWKQSTCVVDATLIDRLQLPRFESSHGDGVVGEVCGNLLDLIG